MRNDALFSHCFTSPSRQYSPADLQGDLESESGGKPILTDHDYCRIQQLMRERRYNLRYGTYVNSLKRKLRLAQVVQSTEVPADVVTMNTRVRIELPLEGRTRDVLLVYPHFGMDRFEYECVLGQVGTALIGSRTGDEVDVHAQTLRVGAILYQPESACDFYL
jgi:regulator of nucleoside diphosphate kinase